MNILIAGSTGLTGSEILKVIESNSNVEKIITFTRRTVTAANVKIQNIVIKDFKNIEVPIVNCEVAICSIGTTIKKAGSKEAFIETDLNAVVDFAKYSKSIGIKKFILISATGADENSKIFYNKIKGKAEDEIKKIKFESLIIFKPGLLIGHRVENRPLERLSIVSVRFLSKILPTNLVSKISTDVKVLAVRINNEVIFLEKGIKIIEASQITGY